MEYWKLDDMMELISEYLDLFEFLLSKHVMLINIDWRYNHAVMHPYARTLTNMCVLFGGQR